jgi:hypothetical protein
LRTTGPIAVRILPRLLLLTLAASWPLAASAYRPFNSTDAAVAAKGEMEIEFGPLGYVVQERDRTLVAPSLILNWGFADRWELVLEGRHFVELGSESEEPRLRVEDTALSLKHVLRQGTLQERTGPSIATELSALLPTINGEGGVGAEGALIVSQRWPDLTIHVNGAAAWKRAHTPGVFGGVILERSCSASGISRRRSSSIRPARNRSRFASSPSRQTAAQPSSPPSRASMWR